MQLEAFQQPLLPDITYNTNFTYNTYFTCIGIVGNVY